MAQLNFEGEPFGEYDLGNEGEEEFERVQVRDHRTGGIVPPSGRPSAPPVGRPMRPGATGFRPGFNFGRAFARGFGQAVGRGFRPPFVGGRPFGFGRGVGRGFGFGRGFGGRFGFRPGFVPGGAFRFRPGFRPGFGFGFGPGSMFGRRFGFRRRRFPFLVGGFGPAGGFSSASSFADASGGFTGGDSSDAWTTPSPWVSWAQSCLAQVVGDWVPQDGLMSPPTRRALRMFQAQQQLPSTGSLDEQTMNALQAACGGGEDDSADADNG